MALTLLLSTPVVDTTQLKGFNPIFSNLNKLCSCCRCRTQGGGSQGQLAKLHVDGLYTTSTLLVGVWVALLGVYVSKIVMVIVDSAIYKGLGPL
jgi:hypothetical protein